MWGGEAWLMKVLALRAGYMFNYDVFSFVAGGGLRVPIVGAYSPWTSPGRKVVTIWRCRCVFRWGSSCKHLQKNSNNRVTGYPVTPFFDIR